ncbi:MAG: site-2 protease family protein [Aquificae bacterium]|nr:site-2 protease family protein [Aquificota bacterium]
MEGLNINIINLIFMIPALLFAVIVHELGHGIVAYRLGDDTPKRAGRLTFNPIPHIDPLGSLLLPGLMLLLNSPFLFGWAKPIPINPANFKKLGYRAGMILVSFAGPGTNFLFAVLFAVLLKFLADQTTLIKLAGIFGAGFVKSIIVPIIIFLKYAVSINLILAIFNLLPVPPLDGWRIIASLLPPEIERKVEPYEEYGFIILIVLIAAGITSYVILPVYKFFINILLGF